MSTPLTAGSGPYYHHGMINYTHPGDDPRTVELVPVSKLLIDQTSQRSVPSHPIRQSAWDYDKAEVLSVMRDSQGRMWVTEGQNRALYLQAICEQHGQDAHLWCVILDGTYTPARQAQTAFDISTGRKAYSPQQEWRLRLAAGEDEAVRIEAAIGTFGLSVSQSTRKGTLHCVRDLMRIAALDPTLELLGMTAWILSDMDGPGNLDGGLWKAIAQVMYRNPGLDLNRLREKLHAYNGDHWLSFGAKKRRVALGIPDQTRAIYTEIRKAYNYALRATTTRVREWE